MSHEKTETWEQREAATIAELRIAVQHFRKFCMVTAGVEFLGAGATMTDGMLMGEVERKVKELDANLESRAKGIENLQHRLAAALGATDTWRNWAINILGCGSMNCGSDESIRKSLEYRGLTPAIDAKLLMPKLPIPLPDGHELVMFGEARENDKYMASDGNGAFRWNSIYESRAPFTVIARPIVKKPTLEELKKAFYAARAALQFTESRDIDFSAKLEAYNAAAKALREWESA